MLADSSEPGSPAHRRAKRLAEREERQVERRAERQAERRPAGFRPLDPSLFSFHGVDDRTGHAVRELDGAGLRGGQPEVAVVDDALFVPAVHQRGENQSVGQPAYQGGVLAPDGRPIDLAHLHRGRKRLFGGFAKPVAVAPERDLDEEVVYLGWLFEHFGRFLLESLARVWFLDQVDPSVKVVFHLTQSTRRTLLNWEAQILNAFGVSPSRVLWLDAPTRVRRLFVPEPLFQQQFVAHEAMIGPFRGAATRVVGSATPSDQPVYLSRRLLSSRQRPIVGEGELEDLLRENGFLIAHPETMSFADQVRLVNGHANIFSGAGSAAHSVLFALDTPTLHLLTSGNGAPTNYYLCSALAGVPTALVSCLGTQGRPNIGGAQSTPLVAETPALVDYLNERGFLTKRLRAALASRRPAPPARYDEAWLYARVRLASAREETLPVDVEDEATTLAVASWPMCVVLARYFAPRDALQTRRWSQRFVELVGTETDVTRLAYHHGEVLSWVGEIAKRCDPRTAGQLAAVLSDRFAVDQPAVTGEPMAARADQLDS